MTGFLISLLMRSHGLDVSTLSARANVPRQAGERALAGDVSTGNLKRIARALGVEVEDLGAVAAPGLDNVPEWRQLGEALYQHGNRSGWGDVQKFAAVMLHKWGLEVAALKLARARR